MRCLLSLLFFLLVVPITFAAKPVAMVDTVKGHAFILRNGVTKELRAADLVEDMNEVYVEDGGLVTLRTSDEQFWHLPSLSHIHFLNKIVELKKGQVWFQNKATKNAHEIQTANAVVTYWGGEGIVSYDAVNAKTQFLSISGGMEFSNILDKDQTVVVDQGKFSFVDDQIDSGKPRQAMSIGKKSYDSFTSIFPGITPFSPSSQMALENKVTMPQMVADEDDIINQALNKNAKAVVPKREIASVSNAPTINEKRNFMVRRLPPEIEIKDFNVENYNDQKIEKIKKDKLSKKFVPSYNKKSTVVIKIFGVENRPLNISTPAQVTTVTAPQILESEVAKDSVAILENKEKAAEVVRSPASVDIKKDPVFESGLVDQYKKQMRHSNETNTLINELKSYRQDYKKEY